MWRIFNQKNKKGDMKNIMPKPETDVLSRYPGEHGSIVQAERLEPLSERLHRRLEFFFFHHAPDSTLSLTPNAIHRALFPFPIASAPSRDDPSLPKVFLSGSPPLRLFAYSKTPSPPLPQYRFLAVQWLSQKSAWLLITGY